MIRLNKSKNNNRTHATAAVEQKLKKKNNKCALLNGARTVTLPNQQRLLINVVAYASVMKKITWDRSPPDRPGHPGGQIKCWSNEKKLLKKLSSMFQ